ncbi:PAS-domain containing protein [Hasllibacter sp. MH4015]|uniref:PAS domain-containing protein n=1 Tax=Hasllibacter sp. MH4015 TaxID=2854029 RepID=UPI001CD633D1|nr:PAS-domain containing protein [Hasllibacter sp. MH4015]
MANATTVMYLAISLVTAIGAVLLSSRVLFMRSGRGRLAAAAGPVGGSDILRCYRFREDYLISDLDADDAFLDASVDRTVAFARLSAALGPLSPDFGPHLAALRDRGEAFLLDGRIGTDPVTISGRVEEDSTLVLSVGPSAERNGRQTVESAALDALQGELSDLRAALDAGSVPMWRVDEGGQVVWANTPYFDLVERLRGGDAPGWPLPRIFADQLEPAPNDGTSRRCHLNLPDRDEASWFEVACDRMPGGSVLYTAQPADRVIRAETTLREFLQTTTKTFAALPIGLAVFDRKRQLVTFNPALNALTQAGVEFLSSRPDLRAFLDQLREKGRIPEPRDYRSWRDEIARLEEGAENGTYQEMWELPEGATFRVIGRPHPDGAIAFMIEDISAEVSLTRQFRADLDMYQAVLDASPSAIAVFDHDGGMIHSNQGYDDLWGRDTARVGGLPHLSEAVSLWSTRCKPSPVWAELRQFVCHEVPRDPNVAQVETVDGIRLAVRMAPARGRATVVHFIPLDAHLHNPLAELSLKPPVVIDAGAAQPLGAARTA